MSDLSPILSLPLLQPAQAQKHVTHNEALMHLDLLVQLTVEDRNRTVPPASPVEGQRHIVAAAPTGAWAGQAGKIALQLDGLWQFVTPLTGWRAWITSETAEFAFDGTAWVDMSVVTLPDVMNVTQIGVSASPTATNRLAISSPASLFTHAGAGHQIKVNKAATGNTASLLFQNNFSGRAEMGAIGDDDFAIKVSDNGSSFTTALKVTAGNAGIEITQPVLLTGQTTAPISPTNGQIWHDSARGQLIARTDGQIRILDQQSTRPYLIPPTAEWMLTTNGCGGAATTIAGAANRLDIFPFVPSTDLVIDALGANCTTAVAAALGKMVIYGSTSSGRPDALIAETGTVDLSTAGAKTANLSITLIGGRTYWFGFRHSSTATISSWAAQATPDINGGTAILTTARKTVRRTVTFASAAPANWGYTHTEIQSATAPAVWLRMA